MKHILEDDFSSYPFIVEGIVKNTNDPQQMGRVKVWCPAIDGDEYEETRLPWAEYAAPFAGSVEDKPAGPQKLTSAGFTSYGFWAIPKVGARVFVFFIHGDLSRRVFFAGAFGLHKNRSLPAGRNLNETNETGPWTDSYDKLQPAYTNLREQFSNNISAPEAVSRGAYERQVAQARTEKTGEEGYASDPVKPTISDPASNAVQQNLDPQMYCLVTPGHHSIIMSDQTDHCRLRLKTSSGHQIIFDDTNERIYMSTARGKTWIELDENGHLHIFAADNLSIRSGADINLTADKNINLQARGSINIAAENSLKAAGKEGLHLSSCGVTSISAAADLNLNAGGSILETATKIHLNGPTAACPEAPDSITIIPGHEPWERPEESKYIRNPNWKK